MSPVVSSMVALAAEFLPANVALVTLAQVVSINVLFQDGLGRVRLVAARSWAAIPAAVCYEKVLYFDYN